MLRARNFVSTGETRSRKCPRSRCAQQCPSAVSAIDVAHALCRSFARAGMAASPHCARGHSRARRSACRRCPRATHRHSDGCVKPRADTARHGPRGSASSENRVIMRLCAMRLRSRDGCRVGAAQTPVAEGRPAAKAMSGHETWARAGVSKCWRGCPCAFLRPGAAPPWVEAELSRLFLLLFPLGLLLGLSLHCHVAFLLATGRASANPMHHPATKFTINPINCVARM